MLNAFAREASESKAIDDGAHRRALAQRVQAKRSETVNFVIA